MKRFINKLRLIIVIAFALIFNCSKQSTYERLDVKEFCTPSTESSIHTWWHWMDNSISKEGITKDLEAMKKQGIYTATILNIGLLGERNLGIPQVKFNTEEWYQMFEWALSEANRLGMTIGVHNCDGWSSSGGPWITPDYSMKRCVWSTSIIQGGEQTEIKLPKPKNNLNYYKDIKVLAFPTQEKTSSFQAVKPDIYVNNKLTGDTLYDADPFSMVRTTDSTQIVFAFRDAFTTTKIAIHPRLEFSWEGLEGIFYKIELKASADGKNFKTVQQFDCPALNKTSIIEIRPSTAKYYKLGFKKVIHTFNTIGISELELLGKDDMPAYNPNISSHLEKTVTTQANSVNYKLVPSTDTGKAVPYPDIIDLTQYMAPDGILKWEAPKGTWKVLRIGYTTTKAENAPATIAGQGLECDKMDSAALNLHFRSFPAKLIAHAGKYAGNTFDYLFVDSWECQYQNWTGNFATEFEKRRHYSIVNWLPVICGITVSDNGATERFLHDYQKTIAELIEENYYKHFNELCHKYGMKSHVEVIYGGTGYPPLDILKSNSIVDVPMFEFWAGPDHNGFINYKPITSSNWGIPAQAASLYNKKVVPAEAYTGYANYSEAPWDLKLYGDRAFCAGVNQMVLHSYVHQPFEKKPGMTLEVFGQSFNRHNPWWDFASQWFAYQARAQYILQKGTPVADILYYCGDRNLEKIELSGNYEVPMGYSLQKCNLDVLLNHCTVKNGKLHLDNGLSYEMLLLPNDLVMEYSTLKLISELAKNGAVIAGPMPVKVAGNLNYAENEKALLALSGQMWESAESKNIRENSYGKGKIFSMVSLEDILNKLQIKPDFSNDKKDTINLLYIHKRIGNTDIYFVVNQENRAVERECVFRVTGKTPEIWDPQYGTVTLPADYHESNGLTTVKLKFNPKESLFFVFSSKKATGLQVRKELTKKYTLKDFDGTLVFEDLPGKQPLRISQFGSWTNNEDPAIRFYSGKAAYNLSFDLPENLVSTKPVFICLDEVKSAYEISLNGKNLGCSAFPGFRFEVTGLLKDKGNKLVIRVANIWRNRIIGDFTEFGKLTNCWTTSPVDNLPQKDKPLQESGILSSVSFYY